MHALKGFVVFMGLLIVAGLALVVYAMVTRVSDGAGSSGGFDATTVPLPAGCMLAEARIEAGRLILRAEGPAERGCQQVILLDPESGKVLGRVTVVPEP
ncbi:MAG: hypothetical protein IIA68_05680 [Proteobacteria bacterium]|nr:hypothetical protein [Pseudomonadota bacterium]MCH9012534.1 hypothetical protein [Pseudomonadota bacterium]